MNDVNLKKIKSHEGSFDRKVEKALLSYIKKHPDSYPLNMEEIMEYLGLHFDYESISNYRKVQSCLIKQRQDTMTIMEKLINDNYFEEKKQEGLSEEEIYRKFIDTSLSYEIVPLYYDSEDGKYKLIDLLSFLEMIKARVKASGTELKRKFDNINKLNEVLSEATSNEIKDIQNSEDFDMLVDVKEQLDMMIPKKKKKKVVVEEMEE